MNAESVSWAFLFLVVVGLVIVVGVVVGIIVASRLDRLMAPRPASRPEEPAPATTTADAVPTTDQEEHP